MIDYKDMVLLRISFAKSVNVVLILTGKRWEMVQRNDAVRSDR